MDGLFVFPDGLHRRRPKSKKEVKEMVATTPDMVQIEHTALGREGLSNASDLTQGVEIHFVGPDPFTDRRFYGTLARTSAGKLIVT